ncbi:hypothetical protein ACKWTF_005654 [Chironomus riparius]
MEGKKRIKVALKTPNPLFKQWLKELIDEAVKKKKKISKTYQKALDSLEKYPLTLYSGHDCAILDGFGQRICEILEQKLQQHLGIRYINNPDFRNLCFKDKVVMLQKQEHDELLEFIKDIEASHLTEDSLADKTTKSLKNITNLSIIEEDVEMKNDSMDMNDDDILTDLQDEKECIDLQNVKNPIDTDSEESDDKQSDEDSFDRMIKKYCPEKPINKPKTQLQLPKPVINSPTSSVQNRILKKFKSFSAVGNIAGPSYASSPISKFLNVENNIRCMNDNDDDDEFDRIVNSNNGIKDNDVLPSPILPKKKTAVLDKNKVPKIPPSSSTKLPKPIIAVENEKQDLFEYTSIDDINPLEYEVMLLIDVGESKTVSSEIKTKLQEQGVKSDIRKLHVGDFLWIAKHKTEKSKEYVLPYIIERKRLDDLSSSIKDGRFHEQKFRLKQCGIENVIYLIENYMKAGKCGLPFATLLQAASNTSIINKFQVKFTENLDHTGLYLAIMSSFIENIFKNKKPVKYKLLEFEAFNQSSVKQRKFTVRETFIKQLLTLKGLSVDIALEITKYYPTPSHLFNAFKDLSKSEGETLLSKITIGDLKRKIPSTISKNIYSYFMYK